MLSCVPGAVLGVGRRAGLGSATEAAGWLIGVAPGAGAAAAAAAAAAAVL